MDAPNHWKLLQAAAGTSLALFAFLACTYTPIRPEATFVPSPTATKASSEEAESLPTAAPTATRVSSNAIVRASGPVNLRYGPSLQHGIAGQASPGEEFVAIGKDVKGEWYLVEWDANRVWIYGQLLIVENGGDLPVITGGIATPLPPPATPEPYAIKPESEGCELVWNDEFGEDGFPSPSKWRYDVAPNDWDLGQLHFYTTLRKENARVEDGLLIIEAHNEGWHDRDYTSARLLSRQEWTYGRFEVSAKLPSDGRGIVAAIWLRGNPRTYGSWPASGEIDIMEHVGHQPDRIHGTIHTEAYNHRIRTHKKATTILPTARTEFNLYVLEWTPSGIRIFVNGTHYFTFENERLTNPDADYRQWPFDNRHHMILNISVGGNWVGNDRVDPSYFPQRMEIDFVRVYDCGE